MATASEPTTRDAELARLGRLTRLFRLVRSKDAGPFMLTIDLFCHDDATYRELLQSGLITEAVVAELYGVDADAVQLYRIDMLHAVKVSFPRQVPSGHVIDSDITGGQQYVRLLEHLASSPLADA
jgi:hypothetical protein